jgi:hypothetical protein
MPIAYQAAPLQMEWCLACHRDPSKFVRPKDKIFDMEWRQENTTKEEINEGHQLVAQYHIQEPKVITSCSTCHR